MAFVRERTPTRVIFAGEVDTRDKDYARQGGEDAEEFADCKALNAHKGAEDKTPDTCSIVRQMQ